MTRNQDARPFVDLLKDAEEFKAKFDDDIKKCIEFLDEKITALIRDPDSLGNPKRGANSNPVVEFSKAKYEIFVGAKSLMNEMEREWLKYISEMKKLFIENVEIFLAGTKLEVKLPTSEFQSSPGFKKSPRKPDQSSVTSSIYPLINSFAKNVAALSSPLRVKDNIAKKQSSKKTSNDFQLSSSDETSEDDLVKTGRKSSRFSESLKPTVRITKADESAAKASQRKSFLSQAETDSDSSESDRKTPSSKSRGTKEKSSTSDLDTSVSKSGGRQSKQTTVDSTPGLNRSRSSSGSKRSRNELKNLNDSPGFNRSRSNSGHRSKLNNEEAKLNKSPDLNSSRTSSKSKTPTLSKELKNLSNSPDLNRSRTSSKSRAPPLSSELKKLSNSPGFEASLSNSGSRGRNSSRRKSSSSSAERSKRTVEIIEIEIDDDSSDSSREDWGHQQKKSVKTPKQKDASAKLPKMTEERKETETDVDIMISNRMGSGRKGRQSVRNTKLMNTSVEQQEKDEETDETENAKHKSPNSKRAVGGRKGKKSVRSTKEAIVNETRDLNLEKADGKATRNHSKSVNKPKISTSEEGGEISEDEQINDISEASAKKSKRRASTRETRMASRTPARTNRKIVVDDISLSEESAHSNPKRARHSTRQEASSAAKPKATIIEESEMSETEEDKTPTRGKRGKQAAKDKSSDTNVFSKTPGRASRRAPAEEIPQIGATKSPKKVTFTKEQVDDDDDLDIYTPAKVSKPAIRRKTLLPNLDDISDINSGNSSRSKTKRKTIAVSDLRAITPSKRLKVSESMKSVSSSQDDEDTDDNPLESDGNYTHWIPLKSVDAKIPARPAIYEVKVSRAKKSAYIGSCDSLRQKLTVYKLRHNSGHKHLDKFIDRNMNDIQIRYEVVSSENDAKTEVKNRINSFVAQYKTTPAYN